VWLQLLGYSWVFRAAPPEGFTQDGGWHHRLAARSSTCGPHIPGVQVGSQGRGAQHGTQPWG